MKIEDQVKRDLARLGELAEKETVMGLTHEERAEAALRTLFVSAAKGGALKRFVPLR